MLRFSAVFNSPNRADSEKDKYITAFPKILKIVEEKAWNFRKWEGKSSQLIF